MRPELTPSEKRVLDAIEKILAVSPIAPTLGEIGNAVGVTRSRVQQVVASLRAKGYIEKNRTREPRTIKVRGA